MLKHIALEIKESDIQDLYVGILDAKIKRQFTLNERYMLFGKGGGAQLAQELGIPLLAQIPLASDVCELGDMGQTVFGSSNKVIVEAFRNLAGKIIVKIR